MTAAGAPAPFRAPQGGRVRGTGAPLRRPARGRWLAGVAAGVAEHLGVPVQGVRLVLLLLVSAGGVGLVGYLLLWALVPGEATDPTDPADPADPAARRAGPALDPLARWSPAGGAGAQVLAGAVLLALGAQGLLARAGAAGSSTALVAVVVAVAGAVVAWAQLDTARRGAWLARAGGGDREGALRLVIGVVLVSTGLVLLVLRGADAAALGPAAASVVAVLAGAALVVAPWGIALLRELRAERAARLREAERAEVAAHLHDSVLQTLALIQRSSADPAAVARLARAQERELRAWLYGGAAGAPGESLARAVREEVAAVEDAQGVAVEVVAVGDRPVDRGGEALVHALREAVLNAVRHGRPPVQVYLEADAAGAEAFVRDHGDGFALEDVPADRLGVRESVLGRMARAGGEAAIRPAPGGGTEVALSTRRRAGRQAPEPAP